MKKLTVKYRAARESDLLECQQLVLESFNDLRRRSGMKPIKFKVTAPDTTMVHFIKSDPEGAFVAVDTKGKIAGYTQALIRENEWYLGFLFVRPMFQSLGVGGKLLKRAMDYGRKNKEISRWALATFAYNPQAIAIYSKHGMTPQSPVLAMTRAWEEGKPPRPAKGACTAKRLIESDHKLIARLTAFDRKIRGVARPEEHFFWSDSAAHHPLVFVDGRKIIGYCVVTNSGAIGPVAAARAEDLVGILAAGINYGLTIGHTRQIAQVVGENVEVVRFLLEQGFRIEETTLVMASERFSDQKRYIPGHLAHY